MALGVSATKVSEVCERLGGSALIERGEVLLISFEPIQAQLQSKWESRRPGVLGHAEKQFRKELIGADLWLPVNSTDVLVAMPGRPREVALAACYSALKSVLSHFLGEYDEGALTIGRVTALKGDHLVTEPISAADMRRASTGEALAQPPASPPASSARDALKAWPLRMRGGREAMVSLAVDPVVSLKAIALAGHRVEARLVDPASRLPLSSAYRRQLMPADASWIDRAVLERGLARLRSSPDQDRPWLILQLSFAGWSNASARREFLDLTRDMAPRMQRSVVCELTDLESGVPLGVLRELVELIRPISRAVFVQVEPTMLAIQTARAARVPGISVRADDLGADERTICQEMRRFGAMAKGQAKIVSVTSLPSHRLAAEALAAGFSHSTIRVERPVGSRFNKAA